MLIPNECQTPSQPKTRSSYYLSCITSSQHSRGLQCLSTTPMAVSFCDLKELTICRRESANPYASVPPNIGILEGAITHHDV